MAQRETTTLPTGTVTFLFTDIEGSTRRAAEQWAELLQAHHRLLREAVEAHGGVEVSTEGDAFFVAFPGAPEAVEAAVSAQLRPPPSPLVSHAQGRWAPSSAAVRSPT